MLTQSSECRGEADCFRGIVTEIIDGDTIDVNNVRIRLTMVNTPERGELGYGDATELTKSVCQVGAEALVDENDGQKEGSYDRMKELEENKCIVKYIEKPIQVADLIETVADTIC